MPGAMAGGLLPGRVYPAPRTQHKDSIMPGKKLKLLSCLDKRNLLNRSDASDGVLIREGEKFWEAGCVQDALELFAKAGFQDGLRRILSWAVENGDFFVARRAGEALEAPLEPAQWSELGHRALESGRYRFAVEAFSKAGDAEMVERVRKRIREEGEENGDAPFPGAS